MTYMTKLMFYFNISALKKNKNFSLSLKYLQKQHCDEQLKVRGDNILQIFEMN